MSILVAAVIRRYPADIVVIACNTASTLVLPALRDLLDVPVVGVVPAIKPAAELTNSKVIGLLATPGTIGRDYTDELIAEFAKNCDVIRVGSNRLVELVEKTMAGEVVGEELYREILDPFYQHANFSKLDTVVLACTHFPLVKAQLSAAMPSIDEWVDSGKAIAQRVKDLLDNGVVLAVDEFQEKSQREENLVLLTDFSLCNESYKSSFKNFGFEKIEAWN